MPEITLEKLDNFVSGDIGDYVENAFYVEAYPELREMFKVKDICTHSVIPEMKLKENMLCIYSILTEQAEQRFKKMCEGCPFKKEFKYHEKIEGELEFDYSEEGDLAITDFPDEVHKLKMCEEIIIEDDRSVVFELKRCPRFNIIFISDITHSEKAFERFKRDFAKYLDKIEITEGFEKMSAEDDLIEMIRQGKFKVTLGADVELEMRDEYGDLISAASYGYTSTSEKIGRDGNSTLLELRIGPCDNEVEMIMETNSLLRELYTASCDRYFTAYCESVYDLPLGGHIHVAAEFLDGKKIYFTRWRPRGLVRMLDAYFGKPMRKVTEQRYRARIHSGYGNIGETRTSIHHGIEYRTPPSYWIHSPEFMRICFKIIRLVTETYLKNLGGRIAIPDTVTVDDLVAIGLDRWEAEYFISMTERAMDLKDLCVWELWGISEVAKKANLNIMFSDTWSRLVTRQILSEIGDIETNKRIVLFGLAKARGTDGVYYANERIGEILERELGWSRVVDDEELERHLTRGDIVIGLSYAFRNYSSMSEVRRFCEVLRRIIEEE